MPPVTIASPAVKSRDQSATEPRTTNGGEEAGGGGDDGAGRAQRVRSPGAIAAAAAARERRPPHPCCLCNEGGPFLLLLPFLPPPAPALRPGQRRPSTSPPTRTGASHQPSSHRTTVKVVVVPSRPVEPKQEIARRAHTLTLTTLLRPTYIDTQGAAVSWGHWISDQFKVASCPSVSPEDSSCTNTKNRKVEISLGIYHQRCHSFPHVIGQNRM